jgi:hypothetical protein
MPRYALTAGIVLLLVSNIVLLRTNHNLAAAYDDLRRQMLLLPAGYHVPTLKGKFPDGRDAALAYGVDRRYTILLVYSPACPICEDNWDNWDEIIHHSDSAVRIAAVDLSNTTRPDYVSAHKMERMPILQHLDAASMLDYRLRKTPETIVIDPVGMVVGSWIGALDRKAVREILAAPRSGR